MRGKKFEPFSLLIIVFLIIPKVRSYVYMCWYVNWSEMRPVKPFSADYIDYDLCSHILYSAAVIDPKTFNIAFLQQNVSDNLEKIINSKLKYKNLKVILTIGSYDTRSYGFDSVTNPNNTKAMDDFTNNLVKYLRSFNFDGVLLDYEFPNMLNRGSLPHTKQGFSILLKKIKHKFKEESIQSQSQELLLMAALAARVDWIDSFYENDKIFPYLDYLLLLTYDLKSSHEQKTRITSALFPSSNDTGIASTFNIASAVAKYLTDGANPNKIVIGIPAYGRSFELSNSTQNWIGSSIIGPGLPGNATDEPGVLSYFEICDKFGNDSIRLWEPSNLNPYLVYSENNWIGYEDLDSIYEKMLFVKANNLSGAFLWSIDLDDFDGKHCAQGSFPLLRAIKSELTYNDNEIDDLSFSYSNISTYNFIVLILNSIVFIVFYKF